MPRIVKGKPSPARPMSVDQSLLLASSQGSGGWRPTGRYLPVRYAKFLTALHNDTMRVLATLDEAIDVARGGAAG